MGSYDLCPETRQLVQEHVGASRAAQGLPRFIEDPTVLGAIAAALDTQPEPAQGREAA